MEHPDDPKLVVVVDDDLSVRVAIRGVLKSSGFATQSFSSAELFLASAAYAEAACVIADVQMPGMNGLELQSFLKRAGKRLPLIFITAFDDPKIRAQALKAGALAVLGKPFDDEVLIRYVRAGLYQ